MRQKWGYQREGIWGVGIRGEEGTKALSESFSWTDISHLLKHMKLTKFFNF